MLEPDGAMGRRWGRAGEGRPLAGPCPQCGAANLEVDAAPAPPPAITRPPGNEGDTPAGPAGRPGEAGQGRGGGPGRRDDDDEAAGYALRETWATCPACGATLGAWPLM